MRAEADYDVILLNVADGAISRSPIAPQWCVGSSRFQDFDPATQRFGCNADGRVHVVKLSPDDRGEHVPGFIERLMGSGPAPGALWSAARSADPAQVRFSADGC